MESNQPTTILREGTVDYDILYSILLEWGYRKGEIQRLLRDVGVDPQRNEQHQTPAHSNKVPLGVSKGSFVHRAQPTSIGHCPHDRN